GRQPVEGDRGDAGRVQGLRKATATLRAVPKRCSSVVCPAQETLSRARRRADRVQRKRPATCLLWHLRWRQLSCPTIRELRLAATNQSDQYRADGGMWPLTLEVSRPATKEGRAMEQSLPRCKSGRTT